ncbi:MAG: tRNA-guanine transglycosylase, partial [Chloroflexota bacterium]
PEEEQIEAMELTHRWLARNIEAFESGCATFEFKKRPLLFGIAQGGFDSERREHSASILAGSRVDGCAIGGLSVGEPKDVMLAMLEASTSALPWEKPRYLMGVGSPEDLWDAVAAGVDMFDCVHPSRVARHGGLFTSEGRINARAAKFQSADRPIEDSCDCYTCMNFSLGYLNHLYRAQEILVYRLATIHNLRFMIRTTERIRDAIRRGEFQREREAFLDRYERVDERTRTEQRRRFGKRAH